MQSSIEMIIRSIFRFKKKVPFKSNEYWVNRYISGGNSGLGSYGRLAVFKAEILNKFVLDNDVATVIEFGCGDGNQLKLASYPLYVGYDVSEEALARCRALFSDDKTKVFFNVEEWDGRSADLTLSLDVIYHLTDDKVYEKYMRSLFGAASRFVIIYSSNTDENKQGQAVHVRHRSFGKWVNANMPAWSLVNKVPNKYSEVEFGEEGSFADFYIYAKTIK